MSLSKIKSLDYLVSLIIPVYNAEKDLAQCLESIVTQDDHNFEVILVDDGSTDHSIKIANTYKNKIKSFRIIKQANSGSGGARNNGILHSKGEFILFLDSDDYVSNNYISLLRQKQQSGNYNMVCGQYKLVSESGIDMSDPMKTPPQFNPPLVFHEEVLGAYERCVPWAKLFRKSDYLKAGIIFPRNIPHEDWFFTYKLARKLKSIGFVKDQVYYWRQRKGSTSLSMSKTHIDILPFLRNDTYLYLKQNVGTRREFALAARRNLVVTNNFRNRIRQSGETNFDYFASLVNTTQPEILSDLNTYESSEFHDRALSKAIREIIEECKKVAPHLSFSASNISDGWKKNNDNNATVKASGHLISKRSVEKSKLKLSLITPSYNQLSYVREMIKSIEQQNVLPFEHIILDAGSNDGTLEILSKYEKEKSFVKMHVGRDNGQTNAINLGFLEATGDIISWLNTDDQYYSNTAIEKVLLAFENNPDADVIYGRGNFIDANGKLLREAYLNKDTDKLKQKLINSVGILQPALFMRRKVFEQVGPLNESYGLCFDYEYWIRIAKAGFKFFFLDEVLCEAILHQDSKTVGQRSKQLKETVCAVKEHYGFAPVEWLHKLVDSEITGADGITKTSSKKSGKHAKNVQDYFLKNNSNRNAVAAILSVGHYPEANKSLRMLNHLVNDYKSFFATAFDSRLFHDGLTLIKHIQQHCTFKHAVLVYDLGMIPDELNVIRDISNVFVLSLPANDKMYPAGYFSSKTYWFRNFITWHAGKILPKGSDFVYFDSDTVPLSDLKLVTELVSKQEILLVKQSANSKGEKPVALSYTDDRCISALNAENRELVSPLLNAGILGYKIGGKYNDFFEESFNYSLITDIFHKEGSSDGVLMPEDSNQVQRNYILDKPEETNKLPKQELRKIFGFLGRKHYQSVISILAARFNAPKSEAGLINALRREEDKPERLQQKANEKVFADFELDNRLLKKEAFCVQHQRQYVNSHGLSFNIEMKPRAVIMGNGPSLRGFDFNRLKNFDVFGMNAAYRFWDRLDWYPQFYSCLDLLVGESHAHEIKRLIENAHIYGIKRFLLLDNLIQKLEVSRNRNRVINFDILKNGSELLSAPSVTTGSHTAAWASFLGYKEIFLLGIDSNYVENIEGAKSLGGRVVQMETTPHNNPNYFFDDYQQKGDVSQTPNPDRPLHLQSWREIAGRIRNTSSKIINANLISRVDAFDFCHFSEIEKGSIKTILKRENAAINRVIHKSLVNSLSQKGINRKPLLLTIGNNDSLNLQPYLNDKWDIFCLSKEKDQIKKIKDNYELVLAEKTKPDSFAIIPGFQSLIYDYVIYQNIIPDEKILTIDEKTEKNRAPLPSDSISYLYINDIVFLRRLIKSIARLKAHIANIEVHFDNVTDNSIMAFLTETSHHLQIAGYSVYHAIWHTFNESEQQANERFSFQPFQTELDAHVSRCSIYAFTDALDTNDLHHQIEDLDYDKLYRLQKFGFAFESYFKAGKVKEETTTFSLSAPSSSNYIAFRYSGKVKPDDLIVGKISFVSKSPALFRLMLCRDGNTPFEFGDKKFKTEAGKHVFEVNHRFEFYHPGVRIQLGIEGSEVNVSDIKTQLVVIRNGKEVSVRGVKERVAESTINTTRSLKPETISPFKKMLFYTNRGLREFYRRTLEFILPQNTKRRIWAGIFKKNLVLLFEKIGRKFN